MNISEITNAVVRTYDQTDLPDGGNVKNFKDGTIIYYNKFNKFHRLDGPAAWREHGLGIGYYINGHFYPGIAGILNNLGIQYPYKSNSRLVAWLNQNKEIVVKEILLLIQKYQDPIIALPIIHALKVTGVDWPELDAIKRSAESQVIKESNSNNTITIDKHGVKRYWKNDKLHRKDGPALIHPNGKEFWYKNGKFHRLDGPAASFPKNYQMYYVNGKRHRIDGPAVMYSNGNYEYYINGELYDNIPTFLRKLKIKYPFKFNPELAANLDLQKHDILKNLLSAIREHGDLKLALPIIHALKVTGVDWPELDAIKRSAESRAINEDDSFTGMVHKFNREEHWLNGKRHREDGPAVIYPDGTKEYWINGKLHREDGPAIIGPNGKEIWYKNGKFHRLDGPAMIQAADQKEHWKEYWFIDDIHYPIISDMLQKLGINYPFKPKPKLAARLNNYKTKIIKNILLAIKECGDSKIVLPIIHALKATGVTWPELDAIKRSADSQVINEDSSIKNILDENRNIKKYYVDNKLHREDGPAVIYPGGREEYWINDRHHREDGPAVLTPSGHKEYWINGRLHREDGPAVITPYGREEYWVNSKLHRKDGPAVIRPNGHNEYWLNGEKHRIDGPAVTYQSGNHEYWVNYNHLSGAYNMLRRLGIQYPYKLAPELIPTINRRKRQIIRNILSTIKDTSNSAVALPIIHALKATGVTWPELDAIKRSADSQVIKEDEEDDLYTGVTHKFNREEHWLNGKLHRENGPAITWGNGSKGWYKNGQLHREDGPAMIHAHGDQEYYRNGQLHREDGPAIKWSNGVQEYYRNGQLHREDGPAVIRQNQNHEYFINDKNSKFTNAIFNKFGIKYPYKSDSIIVDKLNQNKEEVIKKILSAIKEHGDSKLALPIIHALKVTGVNWPELDVIKRSADSQVISEDDSDNFVIDSLGAKRYQKNGKLHRTDGPAVIHTNGTEVYYKNGKTHRVNGPAVIHPDGTKEYWVNDKLHREDGPAIITPDGHNEYWVNDENIYLSALLDKFGITYPYKHNKKLTDKLNQNKQDVIKEILLIIKKYNNSTAALPIIHALHVTGVNWPELDVIKRSADSQVVNEDDNPLDRYKYTVENLPNGNTIRHFRDGSTIYYDKNNNIHRDDDLPAFIDVLHGTQEWYKNNKLHREDKPAIVHRDGSHSWYRHGEHHRLDGPSIDWKHIRKWYVNGYDITNDINYFLKTYSIKYPIEKDENAVKKLDANKTNIIKYLLKQIKNNSIVEIVLPIIDIFKKVGVTWPELDVIKKSASSQDITESIHDEFVTAEQIRVLKHNLTHYNNSSDSSFIIINWIIDCERWGNNYKQITNTLSDPKIEHMIKIWMNAMFKKHTGIQVIFNTLYMMCNHHLYVRWTKTNIPFDPNKEIILKTLLTDLKAGDIANSILDHINALIYFGCDWPELNIIKKSIESDKIKLHENITSDEFVTADEIESLKRTLTRYAKTRYVNSSDAPYALAHWIQQSEIAGNSYKQISNTLSDPNIEHIIKVWMNTMFKGSTNIQGMFNILLTMSNPSIQVRWTKTDIPFESNKKTIIERLLFIIKHFILNSLVIDWVDALKYFGCDWPELDIIKKSLEADRVPMSEDILPTKRLSEAIEPHRIELLDAIINQTDSYGITVGNWIDRMQVINHPSKEIFNVLLAKQDQISQWVSKLLTSSDYKNTMAVIGTLNTMYNMKFHLENLYKVLSSNKNIIIKGLLNAFRRRSTSIYMLYELADYIGALRYFRCDWPELNTIEKSLDDVIKNYR